MLSYQSYEFYPHPLLKSFITRHEWLGRISLTPTHFFTARYNGILAGVVADLRPAGSGVVGRHGLGRGAAVRADLSDLRGLALTTY